MTSGDITITPVGPRVRWQQTSPSLVILLRLANRLIDPPPPLPADIPLVQQFAATSVHWALYALLIVQPIAGWIGTSAFRAPIIVFGLFELPPIWPPDA